MDNPFKHLSKGEKIAVAVGSLVVVWFAWKQHASGSSGSASNPNAIDPVTGMPYSQDATVDPLTGQTYLAEAQQYGSVQAAEAALGGSGNVYGGYNPGTYGYPPAGTTGGGSNANYASNAQWAQAVEAGLTDIGYSPTDIAAALGRYLGQLPLTSKQVTIVHAALAEYGPPPSGSYQVLQQPPAKGTTHDVTVPHVVGQPQEAAYALISEAGLHPATTTPPVKGTVIYVTSQAPHAGAKVKRGSTVTVTSHERHHKK